LYTVLKKRAKFSPAFFIWLAHPSPASQRGSWRFDLVSAVQEGCGAV
jgi:hypothetical protein